MCHIRNEFRQLFMVLWVGEHLCPHKVSQVFYRHLGLLVEVGSTDLRGEFGIFAILIKIVLAFGVRWSPVEFIRESGGYAPYGRAAPSDHRGTPPIPA